MASTTDFIDPDSEANSSRIRRVSSVLPRPTDCGGDGGKFVVLNRDTFANVGANPRPYSGESLGCRGDVSKLSLWSPNRYGNSDFMDPTKLAEEEVNDSWRVGRVPGGV